MYSIRVETGFDAAHFLKGHPGKCRNLHGHRWTVTAQICGKTVSEEAQTKGMLFDFADLKSVLNEICDPFDHCLVYEKDSLKEKTREALLEEGFALREVCFATTAENFARYFFEKLKEKGLAVSRVEVFETPGNCAVFEEES